MNNDSLRLSKQEARREHGFYSDNWSGCAVQPVPRYPRKRKVTEADGFLAHTRAQRCHRHGQFWMSQNRRRFQDGQKHRQPGHRPLSLADVRHMPTRFILR